MKLYHAAPQCAEADIEYEGLVGDHGVYFAESEEGAVSFMGFRLMNHMHGLVEKVFDDGTVATLPDVVQHEYFIVYEVDGDELAEGKLVESHDHSEQFYGGQKAWLYRDAVPTWAITGKQYWAPR